MRSFKFISLKLTPGKKHAAVRVYDPSCTYQISLEIDTACDLLRTNYLLVAANSRLVADESA